MKKKDFKKMYPGSSRKAIEILNSVPMKKKDFKKMYPGSSRKAIEILNSVLSFNPDNRMSLDELLNH